MEKFSLFQAFGQMETGPSSIPEGVCWMKRWLGGECLAVRRYLRTEQTKSTLAMLEFTIQIWG